MLQIAYSTVQYPYCILASTRCTYYRWYLKHKENNITSPLPILSSEHKSASRDNMTELLNLVAKSENSRYRPCGPCCPVVPFEGVYIAILEEAKYMAFSGSLPPPGYNNLLKPHATSDVFAELEACFDSGLGRSWRKELASIRGLR